VFSLHFFLSILSVTKTVLTVLPFQPTVPQRTAATVQSEILSLAADERALEECAVCHKQPPDVKVFVAFIPLFLFSSFLTLPLTVSRTLHWVLVCVVLRPSAPGTALAQAQRALSRQAGTAQSYGGGNEL
jgi:hypothetical protein